MGRALTSSGLPESTVDTECAARGKRRAEMTTSCRARDRRPRPAVVVDLSCVIKLELGVVLRTTLPSGQQF